MASLNELKKKIKSIESTSKITNAMKLVATSKLKKYKDKLSSINEFCTNFYDIFSLIKSDEYLSKKNNSKDTLWIVITSNMGLCGSYNLNTIKFLKEKIQENDQIFLIGSRGLSLIKNKLPNNKMYHYFNIDDKDINFETFFLSSDKILTSYLNNEFGNIKIIYTHFINSISFNNEVFNVIPFDNHLFDRVDKADSSGYYVIEPDKKVLFDDFLELYISVCLYGAFIETKVCENGSRRNAMDSATKNANDLKDNYIIRYNSVRQSKITQEINEIVSGSNLGGSNE